MIPCLIYFFILEISYFEREQGGEHENLHNLSRFSPGAFREPKEFLKLAEEVSNRIKAECPGIQWKESFATLGRFDVIDIVETDDPEQIEIEKAAMIIRAYGHSTTETLSGTPGKEFLSRLR